MEAEALEFYSIKGWITFHILWFIGCSYFWIYYYSYISIRNIVGRVVYNIDQFDKLFYKQYKDEDKIYFWLILVKIIFITPLVVFGIVIGVGYLKLEGFI